MKFEIQMKTPDALGEALEHMSDDERDKAIDVAGRWFRFGEYLTVEIDTEAETCTVVRSFRLGKNDEKF